MADIFNPNYEIIDKIGEGGICTVWRIRPHGSDQIYAYKQLKEISPQNIEALSREYFFLKFHPHPGIIKAYDFVAAPHDYGIIMDYISGTTLDVECKEGGNANLSNRALEILEIANFIHHCGYIYNDFKPQNFLIDTDSKLKLIDFNLLRKRNDNSTTKSGTLGYLAPEILTGSPASVQSDVYALGVIFYELASGKLPFTADNEGALIKMVTEGQPAPLNIPSSCLKDVITQMLATNATDRPSCVYDICRLLGIENDLAAIIKQRSVYYMQAGLWPYTEHIADRIKATKSSGKLLFIVSQSQYENDNLFNSVTEYNRIIENIVQPNKTDITNEQSNLQIINCGNAYSDKLAETITRIAGATVPGKSAIFFTSSPDYISYSELAETLRLDNIPDKNDIYINYFLKISSFDSGLSNKITELASGDPEIIFYYLNQFSDQGKLVYGDQGWQINDTVTDLPVPAGLLNSIAGQIGNLPYITRQCLAWLAVYNFPISYNAIAEMSHIDPAAVRDALRDLQHTGITALTESEYAIIGYGKSLAICELIDTNLKEQMCGDIAAYIEQNNPENWEVLAYHTYKSGQIEKALNYNYQGALYWYTKYNFKKSRKYIEIAGNALQLLPIVEKSIEPIIKTYILTGDIAKAVAENFNAERMYLKAIEYAVDYSKTTLLAEAYKNLGDLYRIQQKSPLATEYSNLALSIYRQLDDLPHQAACLNNLGLTAWTSGDYKKALVDFENALQINEKLGDLSEQSKIYNNMAIVFDITGNKESALQQFQKALECAIATKNLASEARYLGNIGYFYLNSGKSQESLDYSLRSYELAMKIGFDEGQLNTISNIAQAYHKIGDFTKSANANQRAYEIAASLNHEKFQAQAAYLLACDCLVLGNYKTVQMMLEQAAEICSKLSNPELLYDIWLGKIDLALAIGNLSQAAADINWLSSRTNLTHAQQAKFLYNRIRLVSLKDGAAELPLIESLLKELRATKLSGLINAALVNEAQLRLQAGNLDIVGEFLTNYDRNIINDVVTDFNYQLLRAKFQAITKSYDDSLAMVRQIRQRADELGCVPIIFEALIIEAYVLERCGKYQALAKVVKQLDAIYSALVDTLPNSIDITCFEILPAVKQYLELADKATINM